MSSFLKNKNPAPETLFRCGTSPAPSSALVLGLKLILFGGKGGSGKTTSATATALYLAETTEKKILIVSTDPAPSIGDSLDLKVENRISQIRENLWAIEFDAKELAEDFKKENLEKIKTLVERGTYLEKEDIKLFEGLAIPGMDEVMAIIKIADLLKTKKYNLIILDTAPHRSY